MMLRWLVVSYARQAARQKIQEAVVNTWQQVSGEADASPSGGPSAMRCGVPHVYGGGGRRTDEAA